MSHRGQNSGANTIQTWNGTRWVPLSNLALTDITGGVRLTSSGANFRLQNTAADLLLPTVAPTVRQTLKAGTTTATSLEWVTDSGVIQAGARIFDGGRSNANVISFVKFVATRSMKVTAFGVYVASGSGSDTWIVGVYDEPMTTLIGTTGSYTPTTTGYQQVAASAAFDVVAGTEYWFALKQTNNSAVTGKQTVATLSYPTAKELFDAGGTLPANASASYASAAQIYGYLVGS